ncbi:UNVERIFIED_CONTAM: hypothetical protein Scaly_2115900 [Sesamum calycinum]|uniref:Uncharacterized protein n=1 Tax=Sesamum calycinum TaxID=2727403 RepID=A0AAW2MKV1_9LAMI
MALIVQGYSGNNRRLRRRSSNSKRRPAEACIGGGESSSVSDKLEALRNLIPSQDAEIKAEQLFKETADYIVLLKTQVLVLQKLVDFYGAPQPQPQPQHSPDGV